MKGIVAFIFIFGVIVVFHEFGHFYFAKKSGILVREFSIGMGPKIFSYVGKDGTLYTLRILPLGGYVRMAGWGDDQTEIKTGSSITLRTNEKGMVTRINLSDKLMDVDAVPMQVLRFDLEEKLEITGLVLDKQQTFAVDHDATIVEEDGSEIRIAPLDVQYQNASIWGRLMTNFAGPMNNFILGIATFLLVVFLQGGVQDTTTNVITVVDNGALSQAGATTGDRILSINGEETVDWDDIASAVKKINDEATEIVPTATVVVEGGGETKELTVTLHQSEGSYLLDISPHVKTGFWDKVLGGFQLAGTAALAVVSALRNMLATLNINELGGPVALYQVSSQAAASGWESVLYLLALLSINLGLMNLIPIPALDGGKIVLNLIELVRRKPLKQETESYLTLAGVIVMVLLMVVVTWNDILRLF